MFACLCVSVLQGFGPVRLARLVDMGNEKARASREAARESSLASGWTVEGQPAAEPQGGAPQTAPRADTSGDPRPEAADAADVAIEPTGESTQLSSGALVLLGLIGGVYLLFTFVWFSWANAAATANAAVIETSGSLGGVLQQIVFWVAPFATALWFTSVLVLCRGARVRRMVAWLVLGLVVLVPLPMFGGLF